MFAGYAGYSFTRGLQFGAGQIARATSWDVASGAIGLCGVASALHIGLRGAPVLLPMGGAYLLYTVGNWPRSHGRSPARLQRRELDAFVAMGVVGTLASGGFLQLSILVARMTGGQSGAGMYAASLTLATPGALIASSLTLILFPNLASAWGAGEADRFRDQTDKATRFLALIMVGIFGGLALASELLVHLAWGSEYQAAVSILPILLFAVCANTLSVSCVSAITTRSINGMALSMSSSVFGLTLGLLSWAILVPRMGLIGVAYGYLFGVLTISLLPIALVWIRDQHRWSRLYLRVALGAGLVCLGLALERKMHVSPVQEILLVLLFWLIWLVIMWAEAKRLIRILFARTNVD